MPRRSTAPPLSVTDHDRGSEGLYYVYAVVSRRSGGVSVGVNLNPNNACNWACVYCQVPDLVLGSGPSLDLTQLEAELRGLLDEIVNGDWLERRAPEGSRRLNDVALSGNGEPTTSPQFGEALSAVARVLDDFSLQGRGDTAPDHEREHGRSPLPSIERWPSFRVSAERSGSSSTARRRRARAGSAVAQSTPSGSSSVCAGRPSCVPRGFKPACSRRTARRLPRPSKRHIWPRFESWRGRDFPSSASSSTALPVPRFSPAPSDSPRCRGSGSRASPRRSRRAPARPRQRLGTRPRGVIPQDGIHT